MSTIRVFITRFLEEKAVVIWKSDRQGAENLHKVHDIAKKLL